jgi:hypothetical protein
MGENNIAVNRAKAHRPSAFCATWYPVDLYKPPAAITVLGGHLDEDIGDWCFQFFVPPTVPPKVTHWCIIKEPTTGHGNLKKDY